MKNNSYLQIHPSRMKVIYFSILSLLTCTAWSDHNTDLPFFNASWIAATDDTGLPIDSPMQRSEIEPTGSKRSLPIFRKSFVLNNNTISHARAAVCGLGHFELFVNGKKAGDNFLDPAWSDYTDTCYYVSFDIAELLVPGENVLGVMLGNGMYNVTGGRYTKFTGSFGQPKLILGLVISQGGKERVISTDSSWSTSDGPITFSCIYGGEDYDAAKVQPGWDKPGFNDSHWQPARIVEGPGGKLKAAVSPPIKVIRRLKPISIKKAAEGKYEVDLGENISARPVVTVKGKPGDMVNLQVAEVKGKPWQGHSYSYRLKGSNEPECFTPRFTYFGFQYIYVSGVNWEGDTSQGKDLCTLVDINADFVSSCGPRIGSFSCSNTLFNEINDMIDRSVASNLQHVLTDCPHREKLGWLEVSHLMGPSILFNYDMQGLYKKICVDTTDSQLKSGMVPDIAPEYVRFKWRIF